MVRLTAWLRHGLAAAATIVPLTAQHESPAPDFRFDVSLGAGKGEHLTDGSNLDGDAGAGFFRLRFEGFGDQGIGGGVRLEGWSSEDDIFAGTGQPATDVTTASLFLHASFLLGEDELYMPLRVGVLLHNHVLEETATREQATFSSFGLQVELAPEFFVHHDDSFRWSIYSELGFAVAGTVAEVDTVAGDFDSSSWMYGFEFGTRFYFGHVVLGIAYVARGEEMDETDPNGGNVVLGYESGFEGILLSFGATF